MIFTNCTVLPIISVVRCVDIILEVLKKVYGYLLMVLIFKIMLISQNITTKVYEKVIYGNSQTPAVLINPKSLAYIR